MRNLNRGIAMSLFFCLFLSGCLEIQNQNESIGDITISTKTQNFLGSWEKESLQLRFLSNESCVIDGQYGTWSFSGNKLNVSINNSDFQFNFEFFNDYNKLQLVGNPEYSGTWTKMN